MDEEHICKRDVSSLFTCCKIFDKFPFIPTMIEVFEVKKEEKSEKFYAFLSNDGEISIVSSTSLKPVLETKLNIRIASTHKFTSNSIFCISPEKKVQKILFNGETMSVKNIELDNIVFIIKIPNQDSTIFINSSSSVFKVDLDLNITKLFDAECGTPVSATATTNQIVISAEKLVIGSISTENDFSIIENCEPYKKLVTCDDNLIYALPFGRAVVSLTIGEKSVIRKEDILPLKSDEVVDAAMIAPGVFAFIRSVTKDVHICCGPAQRAPNRSSPAPRPMMRCNVKSFPVSRVLPLGGGAFVLGARDGTCLVCRFAKRVPAEEPRAGGALFDGGRIVCRFTHPGGARDETELQPRFNHHGGAVAALADGGGAFVSLGEDGSAVLWEDLPEWWTAARSIAPFRM